MDQARLVYTAETTATTLTADRVMMDFDTSGNDSLLQNTLVSGHSVMETSPLLSRAWIRPIRAFSRAT